MSTDYVPLSTRILTTAAAFANLLSSNALSNSRPIVHLSDKLDRPPQVLSNAILIFTLATLLLNPDGLASIISDLITFSIGLTGTLTYFRNLEAETGSGHPHHGEMRRVLDFWVVLGGCTGVESVLGRDVVSWLVPLWWVGKVAVMGWIMLGSTTVNTNEAMTGTRRDLGRSAVATSTDVGTATAKLPFEPSSAKNKRSNLRLRSLPNRTQPSGQEDRVPSPELVRYRNTADGPELVSHVDEKGQLSEGVEVNDVTFCSPATHNDDHQITSLDPHESQAVPALNGSATSRYSEHGDAGSSTDSPAFGLASQEETVSSDSEEVPMILSQAGDTSPLTASVPLSSNEDEGVTKMTLDQLLAMEGESAGDGSSDRREKGE